MRIEIDPDALRPLIEETVRHALAAASKANYRLAYSEKEAAEIVGMAVHQLRDRRLEGKVKAKRIGKSYYYHRAELERLVSPDKK